MQNCVAPASAVTSSEFTPGGIRQNTNHLPPGLVNDKVQVDFLWSFLVWSHQYIFQPGTNEEVEGEQACYLATIEVIER